MMKKLLFLVSCIVAIEITPVWQSETDYGTFEYHNKLSPVVIGDYVFAGDNFSNLYKFQFSSGKLLLKKTLNTKSFNTNIVKFDQYLIFGSANGELVLVNQDNLRVVKKIKLDGAIYSTPAIKDGFVYVKTVYEKFYKLDKNLNIIWVNDSQIDSNYMGLQGDAKAFFNNSGSVFMTHEPNKVIELSAANGAKISTTLLSKNVEFGEDYIDIIADPIYDNENEQVVYIQGYNVDTLAFDVKTKEILWKLPNTQIHAGACVTDDFFIFANGHGLKAVYKDSGTKKWEITLTDAVFTKPTVVSDNYVAVASSKGKVYLINVSLGIIEYEYSIEKDSIAADIIKVDDNILVQTRAGKLILFAINE